MVRRTGSIRSSQRRRVSRKFRRGRSLGKRRVSTRRRKTSYRRSRVRRRTQRRRRRRGTHVGGAAGQTYMHGIPWADVRKAETAEEAKHGGDSVARSRDGTARNPFFHIIDLRKKAIADNVIPGGNPEDWQACTRPADHGPDILCTPVKQKKNTRPISCCGGPPEKN
jgi:hypothetical protein